MTLQEKIAQFLTNDLELDVPDNPSPAFTVAAAQCVLLKEFNEAAAEIIEELQTIAELLAG